MSDNPPMWGPSRCWSWGEYGRYELSYYSRERRTTGHRWMFCIGGSCSTARTPWGAVLRALRYYRSQRRPA